jgi:hypothetical protein
LWVQGATFFLKFVSATKFVVSRICPILESSVGLYKHKTLVVDVRTPLHTLSLCLEGLAQIILYLIRVHWDLSHHLVSSAKVIHLQRRLAVRVSSRSMRELDPKPYDLHLKTIQFQLTCIHVDWSWPLHKKLCKMAFPFVYCLGSASLKHNKKPQGWSKCWI